MCASWLRGVGQFGFVFSGVRFRNHRSLLRLSAFVAGIVCECVSECVCF